jgi:signal transduction histidine kinase
VIPQHTGVFTQAARAWFAAYLINILAIAGPIAAAFMFFHLWQGLLSPVFLPLTLLCLPWPFLALFKKSVPLDIKTALLALFFLVAAFLITTEKGLLVQAVLMAIFAAITLMVSYGNRGFYLAVLACFGLLSWSAGDIIFHSFSADTIAPFWATLGQTLTLGVILFVLLFGLRGVSTMLAQQSNLLDDQSFTISKTQEVAQLANQSLELLETTVPCLLITLQFDGTVTFQNSHSASLLRVNEQRWTFFDLVTSEPSQQKLTQALEMAKRGENIGSFNCDLFLDNGETITLLIAAAARRGLDDEPSEMICAATDITEITRHRERLRNAEKLESVGMACARIAHDFNNLLTVIVGNLDYVKGANLGKDYIEALEDAVGACKDSKKLTQQIGNFSSEYVPQPELVNVAKFTAKNANMLRKVCSNDIKVSTHIEQTDETCWLDDSLVSSILLNLGANSRDAISGEGNITLNVRMEAHGKTESISHDLVPGKYLLMSITDDGCGIPVDIIDKITEPFFSTKPFSTGLGLGMSTVARLIEAMHGRLEIVSEPDSGTTITIQLPVQSATN